MLSATSAVLKKFFSILAAPRRGRRSKGDRLANMENEQNHVDPNVLYGPDAVAHIEAFRARRGALDHPEDKRSTVFVNEADLVWGWIADPNGFAEFAAQKGVSARQQAELVDGWEFQDPPFVNLVRQAQAK